MKQFIIFLFLLSGIITFLNASDQLVVVITEGFDSPSAFMQRYVKHKNRFEPMGLQQKVNIGRNGLGWGIGKYRLKHADNDPLKYEGDGKAPAGIFELATAFGYATSVQSKMPYLRASHNLICVDDSKSPAYNQLIHITSQQSLKSFEWMRRDDNLYALGVTVLHNRAAVPQRGSCIFLHIQRAEDAPTSGCTSMPYDTLKLLLAWLDPQKDPLLIQIPRAYCSQVQNMFPGICQEEKTQQDYEERFNLSP